MMIYKTKLQGFSLIEVLIATLVLGIGILAVAKLQGTLIRNGSDANQRTVAASIAQKKIDDLKAFSILNSGYTWDQALALSGSLPQTEVAYTHITGDADLATYTETGGLILPSSSITVGPTVYSLNWTVQDYWHTTALSAATTTEPSPAPATSDFKKVTVTVGWSNETGATQYISLDTVVDAYAPSLTALSDNSQNGGEPPHAFYTPEAAPDVIDISVDLGTGKNRQTSKPLPDALKTGSDSNTIVNFEVITYSPNGSDFIADRQEEFVTVDCNCNLSASSSLAYPPGHVVWDGVDRYDAVGPPTSKATATQVNNANAADDVCVTCCRDHHDDNASAIKYVAGTTSGDHSHYQANGSAASAGQEYIESCRLKRVDGILRVFQDWSLKDITVMERASLTDGAQLLTDYVEYQKDFILQTVASAGTGLPKPPLRSPVTMTLGAQQQLEARGIYIDNVYDLNGTENPTTYLTYIQSASNTDRLEIIPFAEVNLSLLAGWTSSNATNVSVTNEDVATISDPVNDYYGTYSRGWVTALAEAAPAADITATIRDDNDGLTQIDSTPGPTILSDSIEINVGASAGATTISGVYTITFPLGNTNTPTITISSGACVLPGGNTYSCSVAGPWTGTIQLNVAVTTGQPSKRCTGSSTVYSASGLSTDTTYNFPSFACN
ncbi:MAG: prepilin-type N-terminal cleavage/methylation domain-containing protein [Cycloclasticus sp.]|nr:prepilin-type N-terminal cleavage/methylation domain-containing protein [Cycloclasticus sp.]